MDFLKKCWAWLLSNFTWSNEDFCFITAAVTTLQTIHWDTNNTLFALSVGSGLKGLLSMFKITLAVPQLEDVCLFVGGLVTLFQIHFLIILPVTHQLNPMAVLTLGAMAKAAFGFFGIPWPFLAIKKPVGDAPMVARPVSAPVNPALAAAGAKIQEQQRAAQAPDDNPVVARGPGWEKRKDGTILKVDQQ